MVETNAKASSSSDELELGIGEEVRGSNIVPFQPTEANPFTIGQLLEVTTPIRKMKDTGVERNLLVFHFVDAEGKRHHYHDEWDLDKTDENFKAKLEGFQKRVKHIYETFAPFPAEGLGKGAKTFKDLFAAIAKAFNTGGKEGKPIYTKVPVRIKVTYNLKGGAKAKLGFPLSPNFIERYVQGVTTTLYINNKYETIEQPKKPAGVSPIGGTIPLANSPGEFPKFAGE